MTTEADAVKCVISGYEFTTINIIVSQTGSNSTHMQAPSVNCIQYSHTVTLSHPVKLHKIELTLTNTIFILCQGSSC